MIKLDHLWIKRKVMIAIHDDRGGLFHYNNYELRLDWSNERGQGIKIKSLEPKDIRNGLIEMVEMINYDIDNGHI